MCLVKSPVCSWGTTTWHTPFTGNPTGLDCGGGGGRGGLFESTTKLQWWTDCLYFATAAARSSWDTERGCSWARAWSARRSRRELVGAEVVVIGGSSDSADVEEPASTTTPSSLSTFLEASTSFTERTSPASWGSVFSDGDPWRTLPSDGVDVLTDGCCFSGFGLFTLRKAASNWILFTKCHLQISLASRNPC